MEEEREGGGETKSEGKRGSRWRNKGGEGRGEGIKEWEEEERRGIKEE